MRWKKLLTAHNNSLVNLYNPTQLSACRANKDMHTAFQNIRLLNSVPWMTLSVSCTQHHWGKHFPACWKALHMVPHRLRQCKIYSSAVFGGDFSTQEVASAASPLQNIEQLCGAELGRITCGIQQFAQYSIWTWIWAFMPWSIISTFELRNFRWYLGPWRRESLNNNVLSDPIFFLKAT